MPALTAPALARSSWRERLMVIALGCALTTALTYPTVPRLGVSGRLDTGDGRFSIWNVAWVAHALIDAPLHLFDANIFYPHPNTLTYSELNLVAGALAVPVYAATRNPLAAHNSAVLVALLIAFFAMWALVRRLTTSSAAGLVAATAYTFCAYTSSHTAEIQLLMVFGFPLVMIAFHGVSERSRLVDGAWLGVALAICALACGYYGVFAGGMVGLATFWWARPQRAYWTALAVAVLVAAALVLPVLVPYLRDRQAAGAGAVRATNLDELREYSAEGRSYLTSSTKADISWYDALYKPAERPKDVLFPGIVVLGLAGVGFLAHLGERVTRRTVLGYAVLAALACWASLGPDAGLYLVVRKILPGISFLRAPSRLGIVATFGLSVLAGFGCRRISRDRAWIPAVFVIALVAELWVRWPLHDMPPVPRAYRMLAALPRGSVVELPFPYKTSEFHEHTKPMLMSTYHWQPLVNGYSDFIPPDFEAIASQMNAFPDRASFEILRARQVRYVVWRFREFGVYGPGILAQLEAEQAHLRLITDDQGVRLYEIVSWPQVGQRP